VKEKHWHWEGGVPFCKPVVQAVVKRTWKASQEETSKRHAIHQVAFAVAEVSIFDIFDLYNIQII